MEEGTFIICWLCSLIYLCILNAHFHQYCRIWKISAHAYVLLRFCALIFSIHLYVSEKIWAYFRLIRNLLQFIKRKMWQITRQYQRLFDMKEYLSHNSYHSWLFKLHSFWYARINGKKLACASFCMQNTNVTTQPIKLYNTNMYL